MSAEGKARDLRPVRGVRFELARVTIEAAAPFAVGTGRGDDLVDMAFVLDANGLPTIPGTTLAGVLRHALAGDGDPTTDARCQSLFGYQAKRDGQASRVEVSFAHVHDQHDRPVPFRGRALEDDPVLALLATGVRRDHVKIGERGVALDRTKFDTLLVPRGARFTFELRVDEHDARASDAARDDRDADLATLLGLMAAPGFRLGGKTRRGLGRFRIVRAASRRFDLCVTADRDAYRTLPRDLSVPVPAGILQECKLEPTQSPLTEIRLALTAEDLLLFGGGEPTPEDALAVKKDDKPQKVADLAPVRERAIEWRADGKKGQGATRGEVGAPRPYAPGTSIKGALRHRFVYHARRHARDLVALDGPAPWGVEATETPSHEDATDTHALVCALFGSIKGRGARKDERRGPRSGGAPEDTSPARGTGEPGRLFVDDLVLETSKPHFVEHVSIDRFAGGAVDQRLFSEAPRFGARFELRLQVDRSRLPQEHAASVGLALGDTLKDLCEGRLALGAAASRGHGYFEGRIDVADAEARKWLGLQTEEFVRP